MRTNYICSLYNNATEQYPLIWSPTENGFSLAPEGNYSIKWYTLQLPEKLEYIVVENSHIMWLKIPIVGPSLASYHSTIGHYWQPLMGHAWLMIGMITHVIQQWPDDGCQHWQ